MNKIFDTQTKKHIAISSALKRGIVKNPARFVIPNGRVLIPQGRTKIMISTKEATKLFKDGKIKLNQIIGSFDLKEDKGVITKPTIKKTEIKNIRKKAINNPVIRHVLTQADKTDPYALYHFLKNNNISGKGKIIIAQNGRVVFDKDLNVYQPLTKWWRETVGFHLGMIDSNKHVWIYSDDSVYIHRKDGLITKQTKGSKGIRRSKLKTTYKMDVDNNKNLVYNLVDSSKGVTKRDIKKLATQHKKTNTIFYWSQLDGVTAEKIYQTFRKSETNTCFFDVITNWVDNKIDSTDKPAKLKHFNAIHSKVHKFKQKFKNGVTEENITDICNALNLAFEINDIFNNKFLEFKPVKKSLGRIRFINSRINHVDKNDYIDNQNVVIEIEKQEDIKKVLDKKINNKEFCYYTGTIHEPMAVFTQEGTYKYTPKINTIIREFNKDIDIYAFAIDYVADRQKYDFLIKGVNYNSHCAFENLLKYDDSYIEKSGLFVEYDLKSAYARYKDCDQYVGFPNHLTPEIKLKDWTVEKCRQYVGYYKVKILDIPDKNKAKILKEIGFNVGSCYVLTSPEILLFDKKGVKVEFISGSYSFKPYHFDITDKMKEKHKKKLMNGRYITQKPYCLWAGKLNGLYEKSTLKTYCSEDMAHDLADRYEDVQVNRWFNTVTNDGKYLKIDENMDENDMIECRVSFKNNKVSWLGHIGGFVTAYTRCLVLDQLLEIKHKKIIGFKLDGFITRGHVRAIDQDIKARDNKILWAIKPTKSTFNWGQKIYTPLINEPSIFADEPDINEVDTYLSYDKDIFKSRVTLLSGPGGHGKTYYILNQLKDTLYLSACWRLNVEQMKGYGVKGLSIHQFLGLGCESYLTKHNAPARIFIDEITQIDKKHIDKIIEKCPYTQIFIAGDVNEDGYFQCKFKDVEVIDNFDDIEVVTFTHNYRCKDADLLGRLNKLRDVMVETEFNKTRILKHVKKAFKDRITTIDHLKDTYDYKNDWVLCSTTNESCKTEPQTKMYTEMLSGDKYLCVKHNRTQIYQKLNGGDTYLKGEISHDLNEVNARFEKRHAFTIHSFQGITIKNPQRLFIDTKKLFSPRQLYTALSRVEYLEQIYLLI